MFRVAPAKGAPPQLLCSALRLTPRALLPSRPQVYDEVSLLFRDHPDLLNEFTYFLPDTSHAASRPAFNRARAPAPGGRAGRGGRGGGGRGRVRAAPADDLAAPPIPRAGASQREQQFFERVKNRVRSREVFQDFIKCLSMFTSQIINADEMIALVDDVLAKFPELRRDGGVGRAAGGAG